MNGHAAYGFQIKEIAVIQKTDITDATVDVTLDDELKATVSAKYSGTELVEGTDYTVEQTTTAEGIEVKLNGIETLVVLLQKLLKQRILLLVKLRT